MEECSRRRSYSVLQSGLRDAYQYVRTNSHYKWKY